MKYLKLLVIAIMVAFTFGTAEAKQVVIKARIGAGAGPYYWRGRHYRHRSPYWRHHHRYYRYY